MKRVLVVDDDKEICTFFSYLLHQKGHRVTTVQSGHQALKVIGREKFHLALVDLKMPDIDGLTFLKRIKEKFCLCQVIIMTGYSTINSAITAMQTGALDYIEKPFDDLEKLEQLIDNALNTSGYTDQEEIKELAMEAGIVIGQNRKMLHLLEIARRIALKNVVVLIQGETGTGKEVIARFIHNCSRRASEPFIPINCAAISESLLESELFGYEKGAFTGATRTRKGFFEIANNGTIFLDEIGEASPSTQAKLLRILESGEYMRLGGECVQKTSSRIIAATNVILDEAVHKHAFRQDLFYRLDVLTIKIPPLRERKEDVPFYLEYFLNRFSDSYQNGRQKFSAETIEILTDYAWPGNVRELTNLVQSLLTVIDEPLLLPRHLPEKILRGSGRPPLEARSYVEEHAGILGKETALWTEKLNSLLQDNSQPNLQELIDSFTRLKDLVVREVVERTLDKTHGDRKAAASLLGVSPRTLKYLYSGK